MSGQLIKLGGYGYNPGDILGHGAFAIVYKGHMLENPTHKVAIKLMLKNQNIIKSKALLSKEISVLKDLDHEHIVRLYDHSISNTGVYLVMEYCNCGDLAQYLQEKRTLPEDTIRQLTFQIGCAMEAMFLQGIIHRDMKPGNILLSYRQMAGLGQEFRSVLEIPGDRLLFKLADFGFARFLQDGMMAATICGSPMYMAPEVLMCQKYDSLADVWSMGVIVYQCLTGRAPFYANTPEALKNIYVKSGVLRPKIPATTSPQLTDLLLKMLVRQPSQRIDFPTFLAHDFLAKAARTRVILRRGQHNPMQPNNSSAAHQRNCFEDRHDELLSSDGYLYDEEDDEDEYNNYYLEPEKTNNGPPPSAQPDEYVIVDTAAKRLATTVLVKRPTMASQERGSSSSASSGNARAGVVVAPVSVAAAAVGAGVATVEHDDDDDEMYMSKEHNDELKKITIVLELCELLEEMAERRRSAWADCSPAMNQENQHQSPCLKFSTEAQRTVEQIVLYRRVLYYLDYAFGQISKAFEHGRIRPTKTMQQRLRESNQLYHSVYSKLCHVTKQSQREDLLEAVGNLLATVTANRLIFEYAIKECCAADMDEYVGDIDLSLQRYKAALILIHGLSQHAKSEHDKAILADCMRLIKDQYTVLQSAIYAAASAVASANAPGNL